MSTIDPIRAAEETGLIVPLSEHVMRTAMRDALQWRSASGAQIALAVNISGVQFRGGGLVPMVSRLPEESGFPPDALVLEITESTAMQIDQFGPLGAGRPARAGHPDGRRRFRHGLFVAEPPAPAAGGRGEDRSQLRTGAWGVRQHRRHREDDRHDGTLASAWLSRPRASSSDASLDALAGQRPCDEAQGFLLSVPLDATRLSKFLSRFQPVVGDPSSEAARRA